MAATNGATTTMPAPATSWEIKTTETAGARLLAMPPRKSATPKVNEESPARRNGMRAEATANSKVLRPTTMRVSK